jgi:hypothetical protein
MFKDGGMGDLDIYRVTFNDIEPVYTVINCTFIRSDSSLIQKPDMIRLNITNISSGIKAGEYSPNRESGIYTIILSPGDYKLDASADGYLPYSEEFSIADRGMKTKKRVKKIILKKGK